MLMSTIEEKNKAVIRRYREIHNTNQLDQLGDVLAADFHPHSLLPGLPGGLEGAKLAHQGFVAAFPDGKTRTEDLIAEGDRVMERYSFSGTNTGSFLGAPPTGKKVQSSSMSVYRLADGKIIEHWGENDVIGVMVQLGLMPPPGQGK
jgi:predicted ester cyclase